jgi:hypothetical protein
MGWEADRARDEAESMSQAEMDAAMAEADAYERDRYKWSEEAHTSDDEPGINKDKYVAHTPSDMSSWKQDPIGKILYNWAAQGGTLNKEVDSYIDENGIRVDPAVANRVREIRNTKQRRTITGRLYGDMSLPFPLHNLPERKPMTSRRLKLKQQLDMLLAELSMLDQRPPEPTRGCNFSPNVYLPPTVYLKKEFNDSGWQSGKRYDYVFMKAGNGYWYGTGDYAPQKKTWDELMDWIESTGPWPTIYELNPPDGQTGVYWSPEPEQDVKE